MDVKAGKNQLLVKICQYGGGWEVYVSPRSCRTIVPETIRKRLDRDFPPAAGPRQQDRATSEAQYYKIVTIPLPADCVLEVGGLAFRPGRQAARLHAPRRSLAHPQPDRRRSSPT